MQSMIDYGVSQALRAEFDMLRETLSMHDDKHLQDGHKKYSAQTIDKLAQYVVCRNYGKACLELAHLCWPIVRHPEYSQGLLHFFWIGEAITPNRFKKAMETLADADVMLPCVSLVNNGVQINGGKQQFIVSASRVALLSALLELLVSNIDGMLTDIEAHLSSSNSACVSKLASLLQKKLYSFLKEHLPTANVQHKYRYIHHWVTSHSSPEQLNDEQALAFWKSALHEEGYVKLQNAIGDIIDYQFAYQQMSVQRELRHDLSLDDMSANEAMQLQESVFDLASEGNASPSWLTQTPKFVSKKEYQQVAFLFEYMAGAKQFPLSMMRAHVFGQWQNVIIQQTRNKKASQISKPDISYIDYLDCLQAWRTQAANTILCCSAVLLENKDVRCLTALSLALDLMNDQAKRQAFKVSIQRIFESKQQTELTFLDIQRCLLKSQTLNHLFSIAKKALAKNNRMGFKPAEIAALSSDDLVVYEYAGEQLNTCAQVIVKFCDNLNRQVNSQAGSMNNQDSNLKSIFYSDLFIFKDEFQKRHGDMNEE